MTAAARALQTALVALGTAGRAAHRLRPSRPSPAEVAALLRNAPTTEAAATARAMAGARFQNRALVEVARRGGQAAIRQLADAASVERLRPFASGPAIFVVWHLGPPFGLLGGFERAGLRVLIVRRTFESRRTSVIETATVDGGRGERSAAFRRSVQHLRADGIVALVADAPESAQTSPIACFGRARSMARGPFALARLTGAPIVPMSARLDDDRVVRVSIGSPLVGQGDGDAFEASLAAGAAAWLEGFVRESPGQLRRCVLAWLTEGPVIA